MMSTLSQIAPLPLKGGNASNNNNDNHQSGSSSTIPEVDDTPQKHVCSKFLKKRRPDLYGQRHAIETPQLIQDSLVLLEDELCKLPEEDQSGLIRASIECPDIFDSKEHRLLFLRCEQYNVDLAAKRMSNYWRRRIELFGDAAFSPLTLANCRAGDEKEYSIGFLRLVSDTDGTGRCNIFIDPSVVEGQEYDDESMVRAAWYVLHAALETESSQQKGIAFLVYLKDTLVRHFDRSLTRLLANSIRGVLPVRVSAIHIFHAPYLFEILFDVVSVLLGERLTKRIKMYSGEDEDIHDSLEDFGILPSRLPVELSGRVELNQDAWLKEREDSGK